MRSGYRLASWLIICSNAPVLTLVVFRMGDGGMKVGIGYGDSPETTEGAALAVGKAIEQAGRSDPCDFVLLFATARHDQTILLDTVASVVGNDVPIYGGGTAGVITNDYYGYAGDQIGVVCVWLDGVHCEVLVESGMSESEEAVGERLGRRLSTHFAQMGITPAEIPDVPVMLFYDMVDLANGFRLLTATPLLKGIEKGLDDRPQGDNTANRKVAGHPNLAGIGMIGNHSCAPMNQWIGHGIGSSNAIALVLSGDIHMDTVVIHGCRPATPYYTVTKAAGQCILEINGEPAIPFIDKLLGSAISPEQYPFFLTFGVNHGERWGEYQEENYASRLCWNIDKARNGIVMFEPDMVAGTEFQLMYRSLEPDYIRPKIDKMFDELGNREPIFSMFANCAGRSIGYGGAELEDATALQQAVAGRTSVFGLYNGVEIASINGRLRSLDWTGVFCLFSQRKEGQCDVRQCDGATTLPPPVAGVAAWDKHRASKISAPGAPEKVNCEHLVKMAEQNAAKILALDMASVAIRLELEQKRRSFALLSELAVSLLQNIGDENVFITVAQRINAALNMQKTVVLKKGADGLFSPLVLQGYPTRAKAAFAGRPIELPVEMLEPGGGVLVTGADPPDRFGEIRKLLGLPFFTSSPIMLQGKVFAVLIAGRLVEAIPYMIRLSRSDQETVQALGAMLSAVLIGQHLKASEERNRVMVEMAPLNCVFWDENCLLTDCNQETLSLFGFSDKADFIARFPSLSPEYQPDGRSSAEVLQAALQEAFVFGDAQCSWMHLTTTGEPLPTEVTLVRIPKGGSFGLAGYVRDLRDRHAAQHYALQYAAEKTEFLAAISHEIRTPMNAIQSMARVAQELQGLSESQQYQIDHGIRSTQLLTSAIETILDFSTLDSGRLALEITEISVRNLVEGVGGMVQNEADEKSLYLHIQVDPDVPELVLGDGTRLQQVLFNIVANAIKFTEIGGVTIRVLRQPEGQQDEKGEAALVFEISDTGIGIAEDQKIDLFKPLSAGNTTYTRKHAGMGMGLAVSKSLATLMGGTISVESRVQEGSTFRMALTFSLPEEKIDTGSGILRSLSPEQRHRREHYRKLLRGMRVLVADDNKVNQIIMRELLVSVGVEVTMAENGLVALEKLREKSFDMVLMDIQMPEMDGLTAAAQIRADARYDGLPIIAVTANASPEHKQESREAGMNDHLTKPVDAEKLYSALAAWNKRT